MEYRDKMLEQPAYMAARLLDPSQKAKWFKKNWSNPIQGEWLRDYVYTPIRELWDEDYKGKYSSALPSNREPLRRPYKRSRDNPDDTQWGRFQEAAENLSESDDNEIDFYHEDRYYNFINTNRVYELPLPYWNERCSVDPDMARFAYDHLSIPLMSDECERTFSSAKLLLSHSRNRLSMDIIEANECLKAWFGRPTTPEEVAKQIPGFEQMTDAQRDEKITAKGVKIVMEELAKL